MKKNVKVTYTAETISEACNSWSIKAELDDNIFDTAEQAILHELMAKYIIHNILNMAKNTWESFKDTVITWLRTDAYVTTLFPDCNMEKTISDDEQIDFFYIVLSSDTNNLTITFEL